MLTCKMSLSKLVKRRCKGLRPQLEVSNPPADIGPVETSEVKEERLFEELRFDAEAAERKAEEAVQRWRAEHAGLQELSTESVSEGPSEVQQAPSEVKSGVSIISSNEDALICSRVLFSGVCSYVCASCEIVHG